MKVLIIDDSEAKIEKIKDVLIDTGIVILDNIITIDNIIDAKRLLRNESFDVLLLDMQLPNRKGEKAKPKAGLDFLKDFKNHRRYHQPREIIGITEFAEELETSKKDFEDNLLYLIHYDKEGEWKEKLETRFEYLSSCETEKYSYNYDISIICALKSPELDAVMKFSDVWKEVVIENDKSTKYYSTNFNNNTIIVASASQMGMPASTNLAMKIIYTFSPKYLFMAGICAGVKGKVELGDILVADQSWDYGSGKITEEGFEIEPYYLRLDSDLKANTVELQSDKVLLSEIRNNWQVDNGEPSIHIGPLASGAAVVSNDSIINELTKGQHRKLLGIEMEAYGVMYAAYNCAEPKPKAMIVKSVCDFGSKEKDDAMQQYAAYTSASFIYAYIKRHC